MRDLTRLRQNQPRDRAIGSWLVCRRPSRINRVCPRVVSAGGFMGLPLFLATHPLPSPQFRIRRKPFFITWLNVCRQRLGSVARQRRTSSRKFGFIVPFWRGGSLHPSWIANEVEA